MGLKRIFWFGEVSMKCLRGLEPGRARVVDERSITQDILTRHGDYMVVSDREGRIIEHVGKAINLAHVVQQFPDMIPAVKAYRNAAMVVAVPVVQEVVVPQEPVVPEVPEAPIEPEVPVVQPKKTRKPYKKLSSDDLSSVGMTDDGPTDLTIE